MNRSVNLLFLILISFLTTNAAIQNKHKNEKELLKEKEKAFLMNHDISKPLEMFGDNYYKKMFKSSTESQMLPDSIIVNFDGGKSEKHTYTYGTNELLTKDFIQFKTDNTIDSVNKKTFEYDENRNETLVLTQQGWTFGWENMEKTESEYDANGNMVMRLWQKRDHDNNIWVNSSRNIDAYNTEGKSTVSLVENWDGTQWVPSARYTSEYDQNGYKTSSTIEFENDGVLENWRRTEYTFNINGNKLSETSLWWQDGVWDISYLDIYEYEFDSESRIISEKYFSTWDADSLEAKSITIYDYSQESIVISVTSDYVEGDIVPADRNTTNFNSNGDRVYILMENFNVDSLYWENRAQGTFAYNNDGKEGNYLYQVWVDSVWVNAQRLLSEYDLDGNHIYRSFQGWSQGEWAPYRASHNIVISEEIEFWFLANEVFLYYGTPATAVNEVNELPAKFSLEQNYPNPFNPTTTIKFTIPSNSNSAHQTTLKVYSAIGQELITLVNEVKLSGVYEIKFDAAKFASGIYYYTLSTGTFRETKKMILLK